MCLLWRRQWHPTPVLSPGKSHGRRSLEGCSPWGRWGLDMTERLHFHFSLSCIGEGHGNPLQCSCLENPRDRGAWWAAIYGVAQSWTQLKWLSSSPSTTGFIFLTHCLLRERFKAPISTQPPILFTLLRLPAHSLCSTTVIKSWRFHLKTNN